MAAEYLMMKNISKVFPGVKALKNIDFSAREGEIHAIVGENGAGKSTLMKILSGVYPYGTYTGQIIVNNVEQRYHDIQGPQHAGIALIPQELNLCPHVSVAENMYLSDMPHKGLRVDWKRLNGEALRMIDEFRINTRPDVPVAMLRAGQQQLVLLARAMKMDPKVLILDEPTSSLTTAETELLFKHLRRFRSQGVLSIYISHRLEEVMEIADRVTVMRDGEVIGCSEVDNITRQDMVNMMVGREITDLYPRETREPGDVLLEVRNLTLRDPLVETKVVVEDVSFSIRAGEIVGFYGLMGAGRTETAMAIFGAWEGEQEGELLVNGDPVDLNCPRDAMEKSIGFLTEDRKQLGLFLDKSVKMNISIANMEAVSRQGVISSSLEDQCAADYIKQLGVRTPNSNTAVGNLSGGNQQKVIVARWLAANSRILLLDEPTKGIDVGAKKEMFELLNRLAAAGNAVLFISSELPEVLGIADRIMVMSTGALAADLKWQDANEEIIMHYATGGK